MRSVDIVVWDEMSMIHFQAANCVDFSLRDIRNSDAPFGGLIMIFVGDFKQLPPVIRHGRGEYATIHRCLWWSAAVKIEFTINWRANDNAQYTDELLQIGNGSVAAVQVPALSLCDDVHSLISRVFDGNFYEDCHQCSMILSLKLAEAEIINNAVMESLHGQFTMAYATDIMSDANILLPEYVASMQIPGAILQADTYISLID